MSAEELGWPEFRVIRPGEPLVMSPFVVPDLPPWWISINPCCVCGQYIRFAGDLGICGCASVLHTSEGDRSTVEPRYFLAVARVVEAWLAFRRRQYAAEILSEL